MAAEYILEDKKKEILEMLGFADILFCNKDEALAVAESMADELQFTGFESSQEDDEEGKLIAISKELARYEKVDPNLSRTVVVTRSEKPVIVSRAFFN